MSWITLIGAGIMEVLMVIALKNSNGFSNKKWSAIWFLLSLTSLFLLSLAIKEIPLGTAYGVWTGIGAMGSVVVGMLFFQEKVSLQKIILITLIIISIAGLKLV
ncbi:QacE family quaternary ammonium compound efflux SMR transporter [Macrococcus equipercicus]|uniref:QacE family quaternary ammonium compound efflux SMR transporter n=1 Tax=Macrococcus equipercicus TaxID=69967 RepID=A0ABQ6R7A3_9STAP|nr:SMR family transporter [Macrococcus equipercicus]KAA1037723.1 QacE family quaternary ammonium compound efflux SMR transporter [Macrococcus equipercicus]